MSQNKKVYFYDNFTFWERGFSADELKKMEDSGYPNMRKIRDNIYFDKICSDEYKAIFVNYGDSPYFRSYCISESVRKGFHSVNESRIHKACKLGIARAKRIRIMIDGNYYIIYKESAVTEKLCNYMNSYFETDVAYTIKDCSEELKEILGGDLINFEVHHTSPVNPIKSDAFTISGHNLYEFDILVDYMPYDIVNETREFDKMVQYFADFF